jgi:predicted dehydrogenase
VQRKPSSGNSAPEDHPTVKHHTTFDPLLADPDVHVVILCTPPATHYPFARAALEAGKHVLVEKPFVPTAAEADALASLAREKGKVLCVYQNRRWDSDFLTVRRLLGDGTLGRVVEFETHFDRLRIQPPTGSWKASAGMAEGGGVLFDLGTHLLDQVFVLFGMPSGVYGRFVRQREGKLVKGASGAADDEPDSVTAVLSYADSGVLVHVRAGVVSVEAQQLRFWVRGSKGSYRKTGLDPQEDQLRGGGKATDAEFGREDESRYGRLCVLAEDGSVQDGVCPTVEPETYVKFYELFAKAVESGKEEDIPVPATQAAQVLRIIEAIRESAKTGKEVAP